MVDREALVELVSEIVYQPNGNWFEGINPVRTALGADEDGSGAAVLLQQLDTLQGKVRGVVAFALSDRFRQLGNLAAIRALYAIDDAYVKESVLNGLWGEPYASPELGPGIVALAIAGAAHPAAEVRTEACYVIQNQSAWRVDVTDALVPLQRLLADPEWRVRHMAAYATGNVGKAKVDMTPHVAVLTDNLRDANTQVRSAAAWALWQLSRKKHDIGRAAQALVDCLESTEEYNELRKRAGGALLHHARKSPDAKRQVAAMVAVAALNPALKEIATFLLRLSQV